MPRFVGEENAPIRYSIIRDNDGLVFETRSITFRTFREADAQVKDLFRSYFKKEPAVSNQYGGYFEGHPKNESYLIEFAVWNHVDNRRVSAEDIRATDSDAEEILKNYYKEYEIIAGEKHEDDTQEK